MFTGTQLGAKGPVPCNLRNVQTLGLFHIPLIPCLAGGRTPASKPMVLNGIVIDPHGLIPAYAQLKDQIKFACAHQDIKPGDVLPSIRVLARQLNVGDGEVRRAYRELCEAGLLATERRKHVVVSPALVSASQAGLVRASIKRSNRLIAWAAQHRLSAIALGRLLLRQALARESASPSYLFVDICRLAAETSAARTSHRTDRSRARTALTQLVSKSGAFVHPVWARALFRRTKFGAGQLRSLRYQMRS